MQAISPHWADITAARIINNRGPKPRYTVASGITPSGQIHVGNFREVITVDLVARALRGLGQEVRFIYSWDNFDTFRKVPSNLPDPSIFQDQLRKCIARIPDPWNKAESFAAGRIKSFEAELKKVGIQPEYIYQEQVYPKYAKEIRHALENKDKIKAILNQHRSQDLAEDWLPTAVYCQSCGRDTMQEEKYEGEWAYYYLCACGFSETLDISNSKQIKLNWRSDWPMRWGVEEVDFEPGGKDHSSKGGSYDTGGEILRELWQKQAPDYLQYDFVKIKGGAGKMSSSSGDLYTLSQVLEVYEPEVLRWIFASQRPNHDFSISFDEDVYKVYEEFDRCEEKAHEPPPESEKAKRKWQLNRRVYELSCIESPTKKSRPSFRVLCDRLQICALDIERTYQRYYNENIDKDIFLARASCARQWLEKHASEKFLYTLNQEPKTLDLSSAQIQGLEAIRKLIETQDLEKVTAKELNDLIWQEAIHKTSCPAPDLFQAIYRKLISRDQGPRLPNFLKEIGKEKLLSLI